MSDIENNGSIALAKSIGTIGRSQKKRSVITANVGSFLPGTFLADTVDFYKFRVDQKGLLDIEIVGPGGRNINYQLLNSQGNPILTNWYGSTTINKSP